MKQLDFIIRGGEVARWHTVPTLRQQTVAAHSFGVAWLVWMLMGPHVRPHLLMAALVHDLAEERYGDMPAPAKEELGKIYQDFRGSWDAMEQHLLADNGIDFEQYLTDNEKRILKLADCCEYALYAIRERRLGNQNFNGEIWGNITRYIETLRAPVHPDDAIQWRREQDVISYINEQWSAVNGGS